MENLSGKEKTQRILSRKEDNAMQIIIIPGPRDGQKIHQIKLNRENLSEEDWEVFVSHCADDEEWLHCR